MTAVVKELWDQAWLGYNLPLTCLLILVAIYWLLSVIGTVDLDTFDIELDGDLEGDAEGQGQATEGVVGTMLRFVNAQDVPLMIVLSLLILFMWAVSILSNAYLNAEGSGWMAMGLLIGNFIVSALAVKAVTQPLRPLMRAIKNDQEHQEPLIGLSGTVKSRVLDHDFGQIEVPRKNGAPALLNAILPEGREALVRGDSVLVIGHDKEKDKFLVRSTKGEELTLNS
ncbi:MAG: DUF1449 family protein [Verrucomicrobiota bacterium JB023]|nr:DUF1449 family protein [Verrucomicrobiota bacterium JB023]